MPLLAIPFPFTDPNAPFVFPPFAVGPLTIAIRWYAIAYIAGLLIGWRYCLYLADRPPRRVARSDVDDFLVWATLGVVLGGRIGYVLFYQPGYYSSHPLEALYLWHGGMSFHGGALGVTTAILLFTRARKIPIFAFSDIICAAIPIGLFFGRIANFINGELYGRATSVPWAMIFPTDPLRTPRHPSQLYEAICEGLILFLVLMWLERRAVRGGWYRQGLLAGGFLVGYGFLRYLIEFTRQPDAQLGFVAGPFSMGQILSSLMIVIGLFVIAGVYRRQSPEAPA